MQQHNTPVVELLRVSTQDQNGEDRAGIPRQMEANRRTIKRHGLQVVHTIKLVDVSGASILHAPEISEMLSVLKAGHAKGIVAADFDRLLRPDDFRSLAILQDIREAGALIYLPDQVIDLDTQSGFLVSGIQSIISGNELTQIKKRMQGAKEERRRSGKCPGGPATLPIGVGYDRKGEKYFYTEEAEKVREIFHLFHVRRIHNFSELERITGIQARTISNMLRNELYIGYRHYKQKRSHERRVAAGGRRADKRKVARLPHERIRVKVIDEPLIDEATFWEVQELVGSKRKTFSQKRKEGKQAFMFSGLLRCGVCGDPMYTVPGGKHGPNKDYYYCRRKSHHYRTKEGVEPCESSYLRRAVVEDLLMDFIAEHLADSDYIIAELQSIFDDSEESQIQQETAQAEKRIKALQKKKAKLLDLYLQEIYTEDEINKKANEVQDEIDRLEARIKELELTREQFNPDDYLEMVEAMAAAFVEFPFWDELDQRKFLELQRPEFYLAADGVSKFTLPVCKNGNRMGRGSVLTDERNGLTRLVFVVDPCFPFVREMTLKKVGLPEKEHYKTGEVAAAVSDHPSVFIRRILSGRYPDARLKVGAGHRRFTASEVLEIATLKKRLSMGLPIECVQHYAGASGHATAAGKPS